MPSIPRGTYPILFIGSGAPTGFAAPHQFYIDRDNGNLYNGLAGAWNLVGSGPAVLFEDAEVPSGTVNGSNTAFTLAETPDPAASLILTVNGVVLKPGASNDFTISGAAITMLWAPATGDNLLAWYRRA